MGDDSISGSVPGPVSQHPVPLGPGGVPTIVRIDTGGGRRRVVGGWGLQALLIPIGALPAALGVRLLADPPTLAFSGNKAIGWHVLAFALLPAALVGFELGHRVPARTAWRATAIATTAVLACGTGDGLLPLLAPFRLGLLSLALYLAPTALLITALHQHGIRPLLLTAAGALILPVAVAYPIAVAQRGIAAQQWIATSGTPTRLLAQVINLPRLPQQPYIWDRAGGRLIAFYDSPDLPEGPDPVHLAVESVTPGNHPCAPVITPDGNRYLENQPTCTPLGHGLWRLNLHTDDLSGYADNLIGYSLVNGPVTIALTAPADMDRQALTALHHTHPANDSELWTRIKPEPVSPLDLLLL